MLSGSLCPRLPGPARISFPYARTMPLPCFALLDDNGADGGREARSRLYTNYRSTLSCHDAAGLAVLLHDMQVAQQQGLHAVALLNYELGAGLHQVPPRTPAPGQQPPVAEIMLFGTCRFLNADQTAAWLREQEHADDEPGACGIADLQADVDETAFSAAIARIREYIAAGHTYQVNYTYRLRFDAYGAPCRLYNKLRTRQPVPYGALIHLPDDRWVLSFSPELFVRHTNGHLRAQPMKGTAPADIDEQENQRRAVLLSQDEKNRAENLMIVDLLRNDLGRIAEAGSVKVPHLFAVERFGQVLQMTSTVTARLRGDIGIADVMAAIYPCGSITGAPKRRTMQIIRELESSPRGLYTGAIGWFDAAPPDRPVGDFCLSVPIRTLGLQAPRQGVRKGCMGVGAGIVHDSQAADEFAECRLKARFLTSLDSDFSLFETLLADRENGCRHLDRHLRRLQHSAAYFNFVCDVPAIRSALVAACVQLPPATPHRLRLDLLRNGSIHVQQGALQALDSPVKVFIAPTATGSDDLFLRHKTSMRTVYDAAWQEAARYGGFDMLFFNERDELTEGGRSSVFVCIDGNWFTPPLSAGALAGVMRAVVLADPAWAASERTITREQLRRADAVILCNALRGTVPAFVDWDTPAASA